MNETLPAAALADAIKWNEQGLVPVIAQDHASKAVLMLAWMNKEALAITLSSGKVTYWSRSRNKIWQKGETSGHTQKLVEARLDCDGDTLLVLVDQTGPACHTGAPNCFFKPINRQ